MDPETKPEYDSEDPVEEFTPLPYVDQSHADTGETPVQG